VDELSFAEILLFEGFRLDRRGGVLYQLHDGDAAIPVRLGSRAIGLLGLLAARQGEVVSKDAIIEAVWGGRAIEESAPLSTFRFRSCAGYWIKTGGKEAVSRRSPDAAIALSRR
jgi:hypothetical protein